MKLNVFSVFDEKAGAYLQPFFFSQIGQAVRAITDCTNDPQHSFGAHPADYTLFHLGEFDSLTGEITSKKTALGNCLEYKTQTEMFEKNQLSLVEDK